MSTLTVPLPAAAPALQAERERDAERRRDQRREITASTSVCLSADCRSGSWNTLRFGSVQNQRSEKPCQVVRERPSLNANRIAIATGTTDQRM